MFGDNELGWPNNGRPLESLLPVRLPAGVLKFTRSATLNSCTMNSARCERPMRRNFEKRMSKFAYLGQSTCVTGVRLRDARNVFTAVRSRPRQPDPGMTPTGRSPVYPSLFRSSDVDGPNGRLERKSPMTDTCVSPGSATMALVTRRCRRSAAAGREILAYP